MRCHCGRDDGGLDGLVVTEVRVTPWDGGGRLKAFADVVLNGHVKVRSIRIVQLESGRILVAMPNRERIDGSMVDTTHPINERCRRWLEDHILEAYVDHLNSRHDARAAALLEAC